MSEFKNQTIIVTGGTRGIGRGISESFLSKGGTVIATYTGNEKAAQLFKEENSKYSSQIDIQKFDVSSQNDVASFFEYLKKNYQTIEVLINNSGIRQDSLVLLMEESQWDQVLNINLKGTFLMSKYIIPIFMSNRYGRIINLSSVGGSLGLPGQGNYAASKAGQIAFSKSLSKEVAKKGITVNNICPGFIQTDLLKDLPIELVKEYKKQVPMKRFGTIKEVAHAVCFLASKEASYITGSSIEITGGL